MEDMYKNFQILADAKEKAGEVTDCELYGIDATCRRTDYRPVTEKSFTRRL